MRYCLFSYALLSLTTPTAGASSGIGATTSIPPPTIQPPPLFSYALLSLTTPTTGASSGIGATTSIPPPTIQPPPLFSYALLSLTTPTTGASSGIGATTAVEFARYGTRLSLTGRKQEGLDKTVARCLDAGLNRDMVGIGVSSHTLLTSLDMSMVVRI